MDEASNRLSAHRFPLLFLAYAAVTSAAFYRIRRQPYAQAIKWEQYETVFKGTTLGAAIAAFTMSGTVNQRQSQTESAG